jgi:hypothetical protein
LCSSKYYTGSEINEDEISGACGKREREGKWVEGFVWATGSIETTWKRCTPGRYGLDGTIILKQILKTGQNGMTWTESIWLRTWRSGGLLDTQY